MTNKSKAEIGIIGGSGFYEFFKDPSSPSGQATNGKWVSVKTPYGNPSDKIFLATYKNKRIAFLPRHGRKHTLPPHKINYQANIFALKKLGVKRIISPSAAGSLQKNVKRGDFVVCNQFIDRTRNRKDTFYEGPEVAHISAANSYCPELRQIAINACQKNKVKVHQKGTAVIIQGPRFSTRAESQWFSKIGWEVINMTQYPEVILARELGMCYVNISLITDHDAGVENDVEPVSSKEVARVFGQNIENVRKVIFEMIEMTSKYQNCSCSKAIEDAKLG